MKYEIAEVFTSIQGEGLYTGTAMTFIRFVGCSVGKKVCNACDTDFERMYPWKGGGSFTPEQLFDMMHTPHVCLTGGEPLNQDLLPLLLGGHGHIFHVETSGTVNPPWLSQVFRVSGSQTQKSYRPLDSESSRLISLWLTVSPKPGYLPEVLRQADELKVIVPGLGADPAGWMTLDEALKWSMILPTYIQPRNDREKINMVNLALCEELVRVHPSLRLSVQMHKFLTVR